MRITHMPFTSNTYIISNASQVELKEFRKWLRETEINKVSFYQENIGLISIKEKESETQSAFANNALVLAA